MEDVSTKQSLPTTLPDRLLIYLTVLYLLRAPILTGAFLVAFPFFATCSRVSPLLANIFDIRPIGMMVVSLTAFMAAWTVMTTGWVVLLHGADRFPIPQLVTSDSPSRLQVFLFSLAAVPVVTVSITYSVRQSGRSFWAMLGWSVAGCIAGFLIRLLRKTKHLKASSPVGLIYWLRKHPEFGAGYVNPKVEELKLLPGHSLAFSLLLTSLFVYLGVGLAKYVRLGHQPLIPTLAYLLLLVTLICWGTSGLAFFFDRFRVPVLIPLLAIPTLISLFPQSDHYYRLLSSGPIEAVHPAAVLQAGNRSSVIVVAANGGGIQSAAWTTRVITGLEERSRLEFGSEFREFGRSIRMVSSVSGGSVGAMYVVGAYGPDGLPTDNLAELVELAELPSLDDIAWGLVYPDLGRVFFPFFWSTYIDRGQALERALNRQEGLSEGLSAWTEGVRSGWRPAIIFNATIADTGERLLLTNTSLTSGRTGLKTFQQLYQKMDIQIATAARLSATFPYVAPAARADLGGPWAKQYHVVDGGYYDNYGMSSLIAWLDEGLQSTENPIRQVLILEIRGAPFSKDALKSQRGWMYQTIVPLAAMLNVRTAGQLSHNEEELRLLRRAVGSVSVDSAVFQFPEEDPPLSWHLTERQKKEIEVAWDGMREGPGWAKVRAFLSTKAAAKSRGAAQGR